MAPSSRLLMTLLLCSLGGTALARESSDLPLPPRPNIADYEDQNRFVSDVLAWEKRVAALRAQPPSATTTQPDPQDWHHVTGPEDLDTALKNADGYVQPQYKERKRFNRTTHISFPLTQLELEEMASQIADGDARQRDSMLMTEMELLPTQLLEQLDTLQLLSAQNTQPEQLSAVQHTN